MKISDEYYTPEYAITPLLKYISAEKHIWCPFDTEYSHIVKSFKKAGNKVSLSHIMTGHDFFDTLIPADIIVSNPPYSRITDVFTRLFHLAIPFAMLVRGASVFDGAKRFELFKNNPFEIMVLNKRVAYYKSYTSSIPEPSPNFASIWVTSRVLPERFIFETI